MALWRTLYVKACVFVAAARKARIFWDGAYPHQVRAQGMPDAGRTREPCVQKIVHFAHARNHRAAGTAGTPCAMVLRLIRDLLGAPGCLATVALCSSRKA